MCQCLNRNWHFLFWAHNLPLYPAWGIRSRNDFTYLKKDRHATMIPLNVLIFTLCYVKILLGSNLNPVQFCA